MFRLRQVAVSGNDLGRALLMLCVLLLASCAPLSAPLSTPLSASLSVPLFAPLGPRLPDNRQLLFVVSDNNFNPNQRTHLWALAGALE